MQTVRWRVRAMSAVAPVLALLPIPLSLLLRLSGSDKEAEEGHHYGLTYEREFRPLKYRAIRLLEIGIGGYEYIAGGESLCAWSSYFPFAKIVACDIIDKSV